MAGERANWKQSLEGQLVISVEIIKVLQLGSSTSRDVSIGRFRMCKMMYANLFISVSCLIAKGRN